MNTECSFFIEIRAPKGLSGLEKHLKVCTLPLETWKSGYNGKIILRTKLNEAEHIEWAMDSSDTKILIASGYITKSVESAWQELSTLSIALENAGFPHIIALDNEEGNAEHSIEHHWS